MKKILLEYILFFILFYFSLSCFVKDPKKKEDCLNQSTNSSRCCYNGYSKGCLTLSSNKLDDYYLLLEQKQTKNIDCGFVAKDEIEYCERIIPYPSSNISECTNYEMIIPDIAIDGSGSKRSYRCCMRYDEYFNHHCDSTLLGNNDYEINTLKRAAVSGTHYYCKNNNYNDTLLQCAFSRDVGPGKCSQKIIKSEDAFFYEGYTFNKCCYVSYKHSEVCTPFPDDDNYVNDFLEKKGKEGYSNYIIKCGGIDNGNYSNNSREFGTEVTVNQCESIIPHSINDCTKHTILNSEIKNIQGYDYDKCCFYEVGNGINSCVVLPNDKDFLKNLKENSKYGYKDKINLIDCNNSNSIFINIFNLLIMILLFL